MGARRSRSRSISAPLVVIVSGWSHSASTSMRRARDLPFALDRLVRIGVGAERDRVAAVTGFRQLRAQQRRGIGLGEELRLEIEAGREIEIGVRRPRVAIDAAVLAALVGIDRLRERDVRRIVAADDRARGLDPHDGLQRRRGGFVIGRRTRDFPAILDRLPLLAAEAIRRVERRAPAFHRRDGCSHVFPAWSGRQRRVHRDRDAGRERTRDHTVDLGARRDLRELRRGDVGYLRADEEVDRRDRRLAVDGDPSSTAPRFRWRSR